MVTLDALGLCYHCQESIMNPGLATRIIEVLEDVFVGTEPAATTASVQDLSFIKLASDGSMRQIIRVLSQGEPLCIGIVPGDNGYTARAEALSAYKLGDHLYRNSISVPKICGYSERSGLILFEDCGNLRLYDCLIADRNRALLYYRQVVTELVALQIRGVRDFDVSWCYDTDAYDESVMVKRESNYFYRAFWLEMLGEDAVAGLADEFAALAGKTHRFFVPLLLHRDFQSRNIMLVDNAVKIIDYQAARLGPPGYDIASLLIDPYADLTDSEQQQLWELYLGKLAEHDGIDEQLVRDSYPYLAVQRNLQIIGAFAFLRMARGKPFFFTYLMPALTGLDRRLHHPEFASFVLLRSTVSAARERFAKKYTALAAQWGEKEERNANGRNR
jgi:aminoglycoside/choline kinase family phosphotransferase